MAKKEQTLDTPFRKNETVQTTADLGDIPEGSAGKVKLANGLGHWRRYWIMFADGQVRGQISHDQLVRPSQVDAWLQRQEDKANAALATTENAVEEVTADAGGDEGSSLASLIPAVLLERSRAAKTRMLG